MSRGMPVYSAHYHSILKNRHLEKVVSGGQFEVALDLGCGTGWEKIGQEYYPGSMLILAKYTRLVYGVDLDPVHLEECRKTLLEAGYEEGGRLSTLGENTIFVLICHDFRYGLPWLRYEPDIVNVDPYSFTDLVGYKNQEPIESEDRLLALFVYEKAVYLLTLPLPYRNWIFLEKFKRVFSREFKGTASFLDWIVPYLEEKLDRRVEIAFRHPWYARLFIGARR